MNNQLSLVILVGYGRGCLLAHGVSDILCALAFLFLLFHIEIVGNHEPAQGCDYTYRRLKYRILKISPRSI